MRTRAPLIVLALLAVTAAVFCFRAWDEKPDTDEEPPAVASYRSFWLNAAHDSACQVEDPLVRDALLLRLLPYCVRARDTALALQLLEKVDDKASAHVEYAFAARQSNDMAAYRKHLDAAFEIADATREEDGSYDDEDRSEIYKHIVGTLIEAGYVEEAVSLLLRVDAYLIDRDDWAFEEVWELASEGRIADARYVAVTFPESTIISRRQRSRTYVRIAEIQRDDGDGPGATETLQEALAHVLRSDSPLDKAYRFSLIAAAFAQNGDRTEAVDASARCHQALTSVDTSQPQESDDRQTAARTYAELARTSCLLEEPEEAKRLLAQAESIVARIGDDRDKYDVRGDIAKVWMCMNEQKNALAVADAQRDPSLKGVVLGFVISHPSFSATREVTDHILAGLPEDEGFSAELDRAYVLMCLASHHLDHGRVTQAQVLAKTISDSYLAGLTYGRIIEKQIELGSIEQAIDIAARIDDPWTELDVFQLIGKTLAKSRTIVELESFLTAQTKPTRLCSAFWRFS